MRKTLTALLFSLAVALPAFAATPVNVNKADAATLAKSLDGVGHAKAEAIVAWREEHGPFKSVDDLGQVLEVTQRDRRRFKKLLEESKSIDSLPIRTKLSDQEVARFTAQRYRFPGVDINARLFRNYPWGELASHTIGYIGRINQSEKEKMEDWSDEDQANYRGTEYIGKLGIEEPAGDLDASLAPILRFEPGDERRIGVARLRLQDGDHGHENLRRLASPGSRTSLGRRAAERLSGPLEAKPQAPRSGGGGTDFVAPETN